MVQHYEPQPSLKKTFDNQYFELTTKQTNHCHNHPPHETNKKNSSTHSNECESLLL
jgi:hypothetical protein